MKKTKACLLFVAALLLFISIGSFASAETKICNTNSDCASGQKCITVVGTSSKTCRVPLQNGELCSMSVEASQCASGRCLSVSAGIAKCAARDSSPQGGETTGGGSGSGGSSFPLDEGEISETTTTGSTGSTGSAGSTSPYGGGSNSSYGSGSNYGGYPNYSSGSGMLSSGECESGYSKSAGVCIPENTGLSGQSVQQILSNLLFWLLAVFATIAVIAFLISGIQYLISSGDEKMAETAKRNMVYSIIGILIGLSGLIVLKAISALLNANTMI